MIHLAEDRGCLFPHNDSDEYRNVCPNTGITRLVLKFDENKLLESIECKSLYNVQHLDGMEALVVQNIK